MIRENIPGEYMDRDRSLGVSRTMEVQTNGVKLLKVQHRRELGRVRKYGNGAKSAVKEEKPLVKPLEM